MNFNHLIVISICLNQYSASTSPMPSDISNLTNNIPSTIAPNQNNWTSNYSLVVEMVTQKPIYTIVLQRFRSRKTVDSFDKNMHLNQLYKKETSQVKKFIKTELSLEESQSYKLPKMDPFMQTQGFGKNNDSQLIAQNKKESHSNASVVNDLPISFENKIYESNYNVTNPLLNQTISNANRTSYHCASCVLNHDTALLRFRIERIKQEILNKLGLQKPPNTTGSRPTWFLEPQRSREEIRNNEAPVLQEELVEDVADDVDEDDNGDDDDDEDAENDLNLLDETMKKTIIIIGEYNDICIENNNVLCFLFDVSSLPSFGEVIGANVTWLRPRNEMIYSDRQMSATLYDFSAKQKTVRFIQRLCDIVVAKDSDWITFDAMKALKRGWADGHKSGWNKIGLAISFIEFSRKTFFENVEIDQKPILTVQIRKRADIRKKRSLAECEGNNCCSRRALYINFAAINWTFIASPDGYNAYFCQGTCASAKLEQKRGHAAVMSRYASHLSYQPCCAPTSYSHLSIIYSKRSGQFIKEEVPNMIVETCGCT